MKKIVSTMPDTALSASMVDEDTDRIASIRGLEAGTGITLDIVDADDGRFTTSNKKVRISLSPNGIFRYMGVLSATSDTLPTSPLRGDFWRITEEGNFGGATVMLNVGDGIVWNGSAWDKHDNTDPIVTGTLNRISVTGTAFDGYVVDVDPAYSGQGTITTVGAITQGSWQADPVGLAFGGAGANLASIPNGSVLVKMGDQMVAIPAPSSPDSVLTHDGGLAFSWKKRGEVNTASVIGTAAPNTASIYSYKNASELLFKRLIGGTNITLTEDANGITITSLDTGEVNTASNLGLKGTKGDVFKQKVGVDFQFRRLAVGSQTLTLTETDDTLTLTTNLHSVASSGNYAELNNRPNLAPVATSGAYNDLTGLPVLSAVALSGSYNDLINRPALAPVALTGSYTDLTGRPVLAPVATSGAYADLTGIPALATVALSGSYNDLTNRPAFAPIALSGSYTDLINKPVLAPIAESGSYADLEDKPVYATVATTGSYNDLVDKPVLGSAAALDTSAFASAAQGAKADSAIQPTDLKPVALSGDYMDLINTPALASVALSGSYNDLTGKPALFSGSYNDLTNKPVIPATITQMNDVIVGTPASGHVLRYNTISAKFELTKLQYTDLNGVPNLSAVALSGSYTDLTNTPVLGSAAAENISAFATAAQGNKADTAVQPGQLADVATTGDYADLLNKPSLFSGDYADLTNKPALFSGDYADLTNKPVLFSGSYTDLTDKPTLFSGSYVDLADKPVFAAVATSGSYTDLTDTPVLFSGDYADLTNKPVLFSGDYDDLTNKPLLGSAAAEDVSAFATAAQGAKADTAVQPAQLATVATTGNYTDLTNLPSFGTAAMANTEDFATAAQGEKADTAIQPGDVSLVGKTGQYTDLVGIPTFATVALTGGYNDLIGKPILGTASSKDENDFATAAQGLKAESAVQPWMLSQVALTGSYTDLVDKPMVFNDTIYYTNIPAGGSYDATTAVEADINSFIAVMPNGAPAHNISLLAWVANGQVVVRVSNLSDTEINGSVDIRLRVE